MLEKSGAAALVEGGSFEAPAWILTAATKSHQVSEREERVWLCFGQRENYDKCDEERLRY